MATEHVQQYGFDAGELSPLTLGHQDLARYARGLATCYNMVTLVQGAVTRRPGTLFFHTTRFGGAARSRLEEFEVSDIQSYMVEFSPGFLRFFTLSGMVVEEPVQVTGVDPSSPALVHAPGHGFQNNDRVYLYDIEQPGILNGREVQVQEATADTFRAYDIYGKAIDASQTSAYQQQTKTGQAAKVFELATDYVEDDLDKIRVFQSIDVMYILHPNIRTRKLSRVSAVAWVLEDLDFKDGPYGPINDTATTLSLSGVSGSVTVTASSKVGINGGAGFCPLDVGRLIRWRDSAGDWTWLEVTAHTSETVVTATVRGAAASTGTATDVWRLGLWSDRTGYPRDGGFHEDRMYLGGSPTARSLLAGSRTSDYENFSPSDPDGLVADDHSVVVPFSSNEANSILWVSTNEKGLLIGTQGGEWVVRASALNEVITPQNVTARQVSNYGSEPCSPITAGSALLYLQRGGRRARELAYVFEKDGFRAPDLTILSDHITRPYLVNQWAYQRNPQPIVWVPRSDGVLIGLTYDRDQDAIGWHRHVLGGGGSFAQVESVAATPSVGGITDDVFVVVRRTINGQKERYIELFSKVWEKGDFETDAVYVDSAVTVVGQEVSRLEGLWHLEGAEIGLWIDAQPAGPIRVADGAVDLPFKGSIVTGGLPFFSLAELMPLEGGSRNGSSQGKIKRVDQLAFWLMDTLKLEFTRDGGHINEATLVGIDDGVGTARRGFTGVVKERFEGDFGLVGQVKFGVRDASPLTVLSTVVRLETEDSS